jgi:hypothetical protein
MQVVGYMYIYTYTYIYIHICTYTYVYKLLLLDKVLARWCVVVDAGPFVMAGGECYGE